MQTVFAALGEQPNHAKREHTYNICYNPFYKIYSATARLTRRLPESLSIHNNICVFILLTLKVNQNKSLYITPTILVGSQTLKVNQNKLFCITSTFSGGVTPIEACYTAFLFNF